MMTAAELDDVLELQQNYQRALRTIDAQTKTIRERDIEIAGLRAQLPAQEGE